MVYAVYLREVADIETVYEGKVELRVFDVDVSLKLAGIFHGQVDLFLGKVVLAEDV